MPWIRIEIFFILTFIHDSCWTEVISEAAPLNIQVLNVNRVENIKYSDSLVKPVLNSIVCKSGF